MRQWLTAGVIGLFAVAFLIVAMVPAVSLTATASTVTDDGMRSQSEIVAAKQEFFDRVWHERHLVVEGIWESGEAPRPPEDIYRGRSKPPRTFVSGDLTYARSRSDYEWGMWNGKLSALRGCLEKAGTSSTRDSSCLADFDDQVPAAAQAARTTWVSCGASPRRPPRRLLR